MYDPHLIYERFPAPRRLVNHVYEVKDYGKMGLKLIADINCDRKLFEYFGFRLDSPAVRHRKRYAIFFIPRAMLDANGKVASESAREFLKSVYRPF